jgi:tetratricopeptide (TPR) repeat protein
VLRIDYNSFTDDYPYSVILARLGEREKSAKGIKIAQQLQQEQPNSSCRTRSNTPDLPMDGHETKVRRLQALYVGSRCQREQISMADRPSRTTKQPAHRGLRAPARPLPRQHVLSLFCSLFFCAAFLFSWQAAAQQPSPKPADLHFEQGMGMLKKRNWRAAADEFRMAIKIDPQRAQAHDGLGLALARQGKPQEALAEYRRSLEIVPAYAEAHYNLGMALGEWGDPQQAMTELAKAVELKPDFEPARLALGLLWHHAGE